METPKVIFCTAGDLHILAARVCRANRALACELAKTQADVAVLLAIVKHLLAAMIDKT